MAAFLFGAYARKLAALNRQVEELHGAGRYVEALGPAREACELARRERGEQHADFAQCLSNVGLLHQALGEYETAESCHRRVLQIDRALGTEPHPRRAVSLTNLGLLYQAMGRYEEAEPLARQAIAIFSATLGQRDPHYAHGLNNLAMIRSARGDYAEAKALFQQSRAILRRALGVTHPAYANSVNNLAAACDLLGETATAKQLYREAVEIRRRVLGESHPDYAVSLNNLAFCLENAGDYAAAEPLYVQVIDSLTRALGPQHPHVAQAQNNLAGLYLTRGDFAAAERLCRQTLEVRRAVLGEAHPDVAQTVSGLAELYRRTGDYPRAVELGQRALDLRRAALGDQHPDVAQSQNSLATYHQALGNYAAAEPLFRRALEIRRAVLGPRHEDCAVSLSNLANLYRDMGSYTAAEALCREAVDIFREVLGEHHPKYATALNNFVVISQHLGNSAAMEPALQRVVEVRGATLGEHHPDFALALHNLGGLYQERGDFGPAEALAQRALAIRRANFGPQHPDVAQSAANLAVLYTTLGNYAAAEPLYREALAIRRAALGEAHPDVAATLVNLAILCTATGRPAEALALMDQAAAIEEQTIGQVFSIGSESQRMAFLATVRNNQDTYFALVSQYFADSPAVVRAALDYVLRRKAMGAEALQTQRDAVLGGKYPALQPALQELALYRGQIAQKLLAGPGAEGRDAHARQLAEWSRQKERLEAELARQIPEMDLRQRLRASDRRAVALHLPAGCVLVEFVRHRAIAFQAVATRGDSFYLPARYLAFVLPSGDPDRVQMIALGEAEPIDHLIADFREGMLSVGRPRDVRVAVRERRGGADDTAGSRLYAAVVAPWRAVLDGSPQLLLAPDGDLTQVPFEALPTGDGRYLIDLHEISYVGTGRDVLRFGVASGLRATPPLVAADPDFELGRHATAARTAVMPCPGRRSRDLDAGEFHFERLPGTRLEAERVVRWLGVEPWLGPAALEGRLKRACRSPAILHLATHGFFLADAPPAAPAPGGAALPAPSDTRVFRLAGTLPEDPLLRSGLALAGAETWLTGGQPPAEAEDGLLTAEDVLSLDLLATELVVLSACNTGLGEVHVGEGVFGLRRAFVLAGAKTLVMSLWKVSDLATAILMDRFYENLLEHHLPRSRALREAQLYVRQLRVADLRASGRTPWVQDWQADDQLTVRREWELLLQASADTTPFAHPFYWGGFICLGDRSPLPVTDTRA